MEQSDLGIITIGCQSGGPQDNGIGRIKVDLYKHLKETCKSSYCEEIDQYALVLRLGGSLMDLEKEQIWKLKRSKKKRLITIDIDIPMSVWSKQTTDELKYYLSEKILAAMKLLIARIKKDKLMIDEEKLISDVRKGIELFQAHTYESISGPF